jgi:hypothetical protein
MRYSLSSGRVQPRLLPLVAPLLGLGLVALREAFKKVGMRTEERQITYAIEHSKRLQVFATSWDTPDKQWWELRSQWVAPNRQWSERLSEQIAGLFSYLAFELSCDYGMNPGRLLRILVGSIGLFSLIYMVAIFTARGRSGIWATWLADRVYRADGEISEGQPSSSRVTSTFLFPRLQAQARGRWSGILLRGVSVPLVALYFSVFSAFFIGWRELSVGTWIARIQPREYLLRASGWVRTVSGLQSLLSVYLLALWVLTYFGRPFE